MFLEHSNQVASWMERPGPDLGLSAIRNMKNESMLFDNHQVSCSLLPLWKNKQTKNQIHTAKEMDGGP